MYHYDSRLKSSIHLDNQNKLNQLNFLIQHHILVPEHERGRIAAVNYWSAICTDNLVGNRIVWFGYNWIAWSKQARRSKPADPFVA